MRWLCSYMIYVCVVSATGSTSTYPDGITLHNVIQTWHEARAHCAHTGGVVASPINERVYTAMTSMMRVRGAAFYIGSSAEHAPGSGHYISPEGLSVENMTVAMFTLSPQLDPQRGDCLAMNHHSMRAVPCWTRLPYMCLHTAPPAPRALTDTDYTDDNDLPPQSSLIDNLPSGIRLHNVIRTWEEARSQCAAEGTILASPINDTIYDGMKSVINAKNITFYVGVRATQAVGHFVSIEGVPLESMATAMINMSPQLDPLLGDCVAMNSDTMRVVPCWTRLPYMCLSTFRSEDMDILPENREYKFNVLSKKYYKVHLELLDWDAAQSVCVAEGGTLVTIESAKEAEIVKNLYDFSTIYWIFIGLRRYSENKRDWKSIDGRPVATLYNAWEARASLTSAQLACASLHYTGKLDSMFCVSPQPFVCQKSAL